MKITFAKPPTPEARERMLRSAERAQRENERQKAKRKKNRERKQEIVASGLESRLCYHCENGSPEILSAEMQWTPVLVAEDAIRIARDEGRYDLRVTQHPQGAHRFRYQSNVPYRYRPMRFFAFDQVANSGGLDQSRSVNRERPARLRQHAFRSYQYRDPDEMTTPDTHREFCSFPHRSFDDREQDWGNVRAADDKLSTGAQRAPVQLTPEEEKAPVPDHPDYNPDPKRFRVY